MTKLMQWLLALSVLAGVYFALVLKKIQNQFVDDNEFLVQISPIILLGLFGVYSVVVVLYRTLTFNDCQEAADELQEQIKEAKADLRSKGFKFD
ncbi:dolichol-phosphate mannosyltransferase subunit 3 [Culicoides brevitarsis]|uniref:dolichol-phosphate mannosyltransferase subunit 3 n=1 Tax=Culicoides brevitarsis TaxID=469753 RepID=UPI00307B4D1A